MTSFSSPSAFSCAKAFTFFDSLILYPLPGFQVSGGVGLTSTPPSSFIQSMEMSLCRPSNQEPYTDGFQTLHSRLLLTVTVALWKHLCFWGTHLTHFFLCPVMIARNSYNYTNSGHYILCLDVGFVCGLDGLFCCYSSCCLFSQFIITLLTWSGPNRTKTMGLWFLGNNKGHDKTMWIDYRIYFQSIYFSLIYWHNSWLSIQNTPSTKD